MPSDEGERDMAHSKSVILKAIYVEASDPEYKGNPLIEALPPILA